MLNKIIGANYSNIIQNGHSNLQNREFEPVKVGFLGQLVNFAELADKDNSGTINNQSELEDFKRKCQDFGWTDYHIDNMLSQARIAMKNLQDFLSNRDKSQYSFEYDLGRGIDYNDGSHSEVVTQVLHKCDKDKSGYIEEGKEVSKALKELKKKTGIDYVLNNKSDGGFAFSNCIVTSTYDGSIMHKFRNTYVVDNETGEKVLYDRTLVSAYEDNNGDGKIETSIERM